MTAIGELDLSGAPDLDCALWGAQMRARHVVVDLRALAFIDSAGLHSLLVAQLRAVCWGQYLDVVCSGGQVRHLLSLTGIDRLLNVIEPIASPASLPAYRMSA